MKKLFLLSWRVLLVFAAGMLFGMCARLACAQTVAYDAPVPNGLRVSIPVRLTGNLTTTTLQFTFSASPGAPLGVNFLPASGLYANCLRWPNNVYAPANWSCAVTGPITGTTIAPVPNGVIGIVTFSAPWLMGVRTAMESSVMGAPETGQLADVKLTFPAAPPLTLVLAP